MEALLGVRFDPTDEQLINGFLRKRLREENLPHSYIKECQVYDKEPWLIFNKDIKQTHYVFVRLIKKSEKMVQRTAGNGTWKGENNVAVEDEEGRVIGSKKLLSFQHDCVANGRWVMHEYSIDKNDSIVVCAIRNRELDNVEQASAVMDFDGVFGVQETLNQQLIEGVENGVTENGEVNPGEPAGISGSNLSIATWEAHEDPILPLGEATDSLFGECTPVLEESHYTPNTFNVNTDELAGILGSNLFDTKWEGQGKPILSSGDSATCFFGECTLMSAIGSAVGTFNGNNVEQGSLAMQETTNQQNGIEENDINSFGFPSLQHLENIQRMWATPLLKTLDSFDANPSELVGTSGSNLCYSSWEANGDPIFPLGNDAGYVFSECNSISAIGTSLEEDQHPANNVNGCNVTTEVSFQASVLKREEEINNSQLDSTRPDALFATSLLAGYNKDHVNMGIRAAVVGRNSSSDYRQMSAEASGPSKRRRLNSCASNYKRWGLSNA